MTTSPKRIEEFVGNSAPTPKEDGADRPKFVGHLMAMPLTNGEEALIDPDEISGTSPHRTDAGVTVVRQRGDSYNYFVARPYEVVRRWIGEALENG